MYTVLRSSGWATGAPEDSGLCKLARGTGSLSPAEQDGVRTALTRQRAPQPSRQALNEGIALTHDCDDVQAKRAGLRAGLVLPPVCLLAHDVAHRSAGSCRDEGTCTSCPVPSSCEISSATALASAPAGRRRHGVARASPLLVVDCRVRLLRPNQQYLRPAECSMPSMHDGTWMSVRDAALDR